MRETAAIFKPSTASCLLAIRLTRVTHFGQHFLACRLTQSLPQTLFMLRETFGKWIQAYTATCNTLGPLAIHSTHLAHLQHTCPTWPTRNTFDTLGPLAAHLPRLAHSQQTRCTWLTCTTLAPLDLGRLRQLGREWIECGKCVASGSSVSQVGQVRRKWVKCVKCVASGSRVLQLGQVVAIA